MDKLTSLRALCRGKSVLVIGPIGDFEQNIEHERLENWEFAQLRAVAKTITGVDLNEAGVRTLVKRGFPELKVGNIEDVRLGRQFDVVYAGDVIEHVDNVGKFIEGCVRHVAPRGVLIVTTPNPYSFPMLVRATFCNPTHHVFHEHTSYIQERNMQEIARRHGLKLKTLHYTQRDGRGGLFSLSSAVSVFMGKLKTSWQQTYWYELKRR